MKTLRIILLITAFVFNSTDFISAQEIFEEVSQGNIAVVKSLIENNLKLVNLKNKEGNTLLHTASKSGQKEITEFLIKKGADINADGAFSFSPLHTAVFSRQKDTAILLIKKGADVNKLDRFGRPPLIYVPWVCDDDELARSLIEMGADVNFTSVEGASPLNIAVESNRKRLISLFIEKGAKLPTDKEKIASFMASASGFGNDELFRKMMKIGGDPKMQTRDEGTFLHKAASGGSLEMLNLLLENRLPVDKRDKYGFTPMHLAASKGHMDIVKRLIEKGADPDIRDFTGKSSYNFALENNHADVAEYLVSVGVDRSSQKYPELTGDYLGQKKPGKTPEFFSPGLISKKIEKRGTPAFSPERDEVFFTHVEDRKRILFFMKKVNNKWTQPQPAPFLSEFGEGEPVFSYDGNTLYFISLRPLDEDSKPGDENIWFVKRKEGGWTEPQPLDPYVNSLNFHWQFSVSENGNIYLAAEIPGEPQEGGICKIEYKNGSYTEAKKLGEAVNSEFMETAPFIAPDENYLIFTRYGDPAGYGAGDLYISFGKNDGTWTKAVNMGAVVNTKEVELLNTVTPDGKYFIFHRDGYYWMDAKIIEELKQSVF